MERPTEGMLYLDRVILLFLLALFLLTSPFLHWWVTDSSAWYTPYVIWLIIIGAAFWLQHWRDRHEL